MVAVTMMGLAAPLTEFTQFVGDKLSVSCKTKPGVAGVHEIVACPAPAGAIVSVGAPITVGNGPQSHPAWLRGQSASRPGFQVAKRDDQMEGPGNALFRPSKTALW